MVAVSGGADSVALLDILVQLQDLRLNLVVAHLNHSLRGADSDGDQEFVSQLAAGYGLSFVVRREDVAALAKGSRLSLEDAGRRARYAFFAETARAHGATSIAVAHHRDDQAETVLIRLLRGAGGAGLSGMASGSGSILKRPLLQLSRSEIEQYLQARGVSHRTDATNADTAILRNSIRHQLLPFLRQYNPRVSERLAATAEILAADQELLEQLTEEAFSRSRIDNGRGAGDLVSKTTSGASAAGQPAPSSASAANVLDQAAAGRFAGNCAEVTLRIEEVAKQSRGLRLRLYRRALLEMRGDLQRISLSHLEAIDRLLTSERPNGKLKLPGRCFVLRSYRTLRFCPSEVPADEQWAVTIEGEGIHQLPAGWRLLVERVPAPARLDPGCGRVAYLDHERAPFPWLVRSFSPGDRFRPLGMTGEQKLKDLLINKKVPLDARRRLPLLVSGGRILWVGGVRMGEDARVTAATCAVLRVEILEITP